LKIKKFKQIHFITTLSSGGAENMLYKYLKYSNKKNNILVICLDKEGKFSKKIKNLNINVLHLNLKNNSKSFIFLSLIKFFLYRSKIIVGWMYHGNIFATLLYFINIFSLSRSKLIWNIRQTQYKIEYEKEFTKTIINLNKILSFLPNNIIFNSELSIKQHQKIGFYKKKNIYIPNGFETEIYYNKKYINIKKILKIPNNNILISHISRFHKMKNHKLMLETSKYITKKYNNVSFIFCGKNVNLNNSFFTKKFNLNINNTNNHYFLDDINYVNEVLYNTNIFILTSSWGEGFPNIIGEAMLNGCHIISTDVGDVKKILDDTGYTIPINNKIKLINEIENLIKSKNIVYKNLKAKKRIITKYQIDKISKKFDRILNN